VSLLLFRTNVKLSQTVTCFSQESLRIRRKLASFGSVFPYDDSTDENIEGICDKMLEFARPVANGLDSVYKTYWTSSRSGMHTQSVTRAAWKLLLLQIGSGATSLLMQAIKKNRVLL
jgi:hypothetical protein